MIVRAGRSRRVRNTPIQFESQCIQAFVRAVQVAIAAKFLQLRCELPESFGAAVRGGSLETMGHARGLSNISVGN